MPQELVVPSEIPWSDLKGSALEECLYWLAHALGGKDLEWRQGGSGGGAADGGRDLSVQFQVPRPGGEITKETWWFEAKGRAKTVEPTAVKQSVLNAAGRTDVDVLIVATNNLFSNPTRDWVAKWQASNPRPVVRLWDRHHLENLLCQHPEVVIRLFSRALSLAGKLEVVRSRFWNYTIYAGEPLLNEFWTHRDELKWSDMDLVAVVASECGNGDITAHPWPMLVSSKRRLALLRLALNNILYFCFRADDAGTSQEPYINGSAYLLLSCLHSSKPTAVAQVVKSVWSENPKMVDAVRREAMAPVINALTAELRDVCTDDCDRISTDPLTLSPSEIESYWLRLRKPAEPESTHKRRSVILIEKGDAPCKVGFELNREVSCPFSMAADSKIDIDERLAVLHTVVRKRAAATVAG